MVSTYMLVHMVAFLIQLDANDTHSIASLKPQHIYSKEHIPKATIPVIIHSPIININKPAPVVITDSIIDQKIAPSGELIP